MKLPKVDTLEQLKLDFDSADKRVTERGSAFNDPAFVSNKTLPIHRWVPWIAGFSKEFVVSAFDKNLSSDSGVILDPFAGVGTTLLEGMLRGHNVIGFEINPYPHLATKTKINIPHIILEDFNFYISEFESFYKSSLHTKRTPDSSAPAGFQSRIPFFSPRVLEKVLYVQDFIEQLTHPLIIDLFHLAFTSTMVTYSNYSYEPSLATRVSSGKQNIEDAPVGEIILHKLHIMADDVQWFFRNFSHLSQQNNQVIHKSFFEASHYLPAETIDLIVTSPPYLNNYHYNRNTRPHLYWLGLANKPSDLKPLEEANFGTYWQTARDRPAVELEFSLPNSDLEQTLELLCGLHPEKGIYGGRGWANYAATYFNDCLRFARQAQHVLKPGGTAVVVIGNSILQGIMIPTDQYFAAISKLAGLEIVGIDIPRSTRVGSSIIQSSVRAAKANTKHQLYEAVVTLKKG